MKLILAISAIISVACAGIAPIIIIPTSSIVNGPLDSAIVQSERLGDGFTYTIAEGHGIQALTPIITNVNQLHPLSVLSHWNSIPLISSIGGHHILLHSPSVDVDVPESVPVSTPTEEDTPDAEQVEEIDVNKESEDKTQGGKVDEANDSVSIETA